MLELLYATGMRVSEMFHLQILMSISSLDMWSVMRMEKRGLSLLVFHARRQWNGICKTARTVFVKDEKETALFYKLFRESDEPSGFWKG